MSAAAPRRPDPSGPPPAARRPWSPRRVLLAGAAGLALLGAGSLLVIVLDAEGPSSVPTASAAAPADLTAAPAAQEPAPPAEPPPAAPGFPKAPPPEKPPPIRRPPHRLARGSPAPVDLFAGVRDLGEAVRALCAPDRPRPGRGAARSPRPPTTFLLDFQTGHRTAKVVDASVWQRGDADDAFLACATDLLVGRQLPVRAAEPGTRFQMPVALDR